MPYERRFTPAEEVTIGNLYLEGYLQWELAVKFRCGICTVREVLARQNVEIRGKQKPVYLPTRDEIKADMRKFRRLGGLSPAEPTPDYDWE